MEAFTIQEVTQRHVDDLCRFCVPPERRDDPAFVRGMADKRLWALEMLRTWGRCAKLAYLGNDPAGLIQYEPQPARGVVRIHCIYVPRREHWRRGIATRLLSSLVEAQARGDSPGGEPPSALLTRTFPGEGPDQYPARLFFERRGFRQVGDDPDLLCYPLVEGFACPPDEEPGVRYIPQEEDRHRVVIVHGPSPCPFTYPFLRMAERVIAEVVPGVPLRWIDGSLEPEQVARRGGFEGIAVNARSIRAHVLDEAGFRGEVTEALGAA